jgi:hypothetical protein
MHVTKIEPSAIEVKHSLDQPLGTTTIPQSSHRISIHLQPGLPTDCQLLKLNNQ